MACLASEGTMGEFPFVAVFYIHKIQKGTQII
jgi:hypothetical protein